MNKRILQMDGHKVSKETLHRAREMARKECIEMMGDSNSFVVLAVKGDGVKAGGILSNPMDLMGIIQSFREITSDMAEESLKQMFGHMPDELKKMMRDAIKESHDDSLF